MTPLGVPAFSAAKLKAPVSFGHGAPSLPQAPVFGNGLPVAGLPGATQAAAGEGKLPLNVLA